MPRTPCGAEHVPRAYSARARPAHVRLTPRSAAARGPAPAARRSIVMRWGEQMQYMTMQMRWPRSIAWLILMLSLVTQATGTAGVLARRQVKASCYALLAFTALQPVVYGQLDHPDFMFRTLTLLGGLLLLLRHENDIANAGKRNSGKQALSGLTGMADGPGGEGGAAAGSRLQLIGRVLLMVIFFFQGARHLYTRGLTLFSLVGYLALLGLCALVVVGFKARWSAVILAVSLGISNLWLYPFWMVRRARRAPCATRVGT